MKSSRYILCLSILLFMFSACDEETDCAGERGGYAVEDNCGICDTDPSNDCTQDCNGQWGGTLEYDECGICGGIGPQPCNQLEGYCCSDNDCDQANEFYCALGSHNGYSNMSGCPVDDGCGCGEAAPSGCDEICGSTLEFDCLGECGGEAEFDDCGVCNGTDIISDGFCQDDIDVLKDFITNSQLTISNDLDSNNNNIIEWFEVGSQVWENGRIVEFYDWYSREEPFTWNNWNSEITYYDSELSGTIPESIVNWTSIEVIWLRNNPEANASLSGDISILGQLPSLLHLGIMGHDFSGEISINIYELSNLVSLYLGRNNFSGGISSNIQNLTNLKWFWVGENNLSGELPQELWEMSNLYEITVEHNNFTGSIPDFTPYQLPNLYWLNLNDNNFGSTIPNSICNLEDLMARLGQQAPEQNGSVYWFDISNNNFCPEYPTCIVDYVGNQNTEGCEESALIKPYTIKSSRETLKNPIDIPQPPKYKFNY